MLPMRECRLLRPARASCEFELRRSPAAGMFRVHGSRVSGLGTVSGWGYSGPRHSAVMSPTPDWRPGRRPNPPRLPDSRRGSRPERRLISRYSARHCSILRPAWHPSQQACQAKPDTASQAFNQHLIPASGRPTQLRPGYLWPVAEACGRGAEQTHLSFPSHVPSRPGCTPLVVEAGSSCFRPARLFHRAAARGAGRRTARPGSAHRVCLCRDEGRATALSGSLAEPGCGRCLWYPKQAARLWCKVPG